MDNKSKKFLLSFDAKYKAEDAASSLLYKYNKKALRESYVNAESICQSVGIKLCSEHIFLGGYNSALGFLALEPQCIYDVNGNKLELCAGSAVVEKSILDNKDFKLYNYTIISLVANYLLSESTLQENQSQQLSFGLESIASTNNVKISINSITTSLQQNKLDSADNFAQALIMPKNRFKVAVNKIFRALKVNRNSRLTESQLNYTLMELSNMFNAPQIFVYYRLQGLNYVYKTAVKE